MPNWSLGRTGQLYAKVESTYGTAPTLGATDAFRHLNFTAHYDPKSLAKSPERHLHPSQLALLTRRAQAGFMVKGQLYPSGTLNTAPEADMFLLNGIGAKTSHVLSTTFTGGGETTTTGTLTSVTNLAVGDMVQINIASGGSAGTYIRFVTVVAGNVATWAPALPGAPADTDTFKIGTVYTPTTALPASLDLAHYPQAPAASAPKREIQGAVIDKLQFSFDSNLEPTIEVSGPAKQFASSPQSQPGGFTTVGSESSIPSGLTGYFYYGATLYQIEKMEVVIENSMELQNMALGTATATAFFRKNKRYVTIKVNAKVSDDLTLWTPSLTPSSGTLMLQIGTSATKIWGFYAPIAQIMRPPDTPDGEETNNWDFEFEALGSAGNDEIYIGQV